MSFFDIYSTAHRSDKRSFALNRAHLKGVQATIQGVLSPSVDPVANLRGFRQNEKNFKKFIYLQYFESASEGFVGRPRTTIPVLLNNDLKEVNPQTLHRLNIPVKLNSLEDSWRLEQAARERTSWQHLVAVMQSSRIPVSNETARRGRNAF